MVLNTVSRSVVTIVAAFGLMLAVAAAPVAASLNPMDHAAMAGMADDMPCCPHEPMMPPDCQKCLLMTVCAMKVFQGAWADSGMLNPSWVAASLATPGDDSRRNGLGYPPPPRPPRTSIIPA